MRIPGNSVGQFSTLNDAKVFHKINRWKSDIDALGDQMLQLDQQPSVDLDDKVAGRVTVASYRVPGFLTRLNGRMDYDTRTGEVQKMDVRRTEMPSLTYNQTTRIGKENSSTQVRYTSNTWGLTHELTIDNASGDWNYQSSFLGIPL